MTTGIYRVEAQRLYVHGAPNEDINTRVKVNGIDMRLTIGKEVTVYDTITDQRGWQWGDITPPGTKDHRFICLTDLNKVFAKWISPLAPENAPMLELDKIIADHERRIKVLEQAKGIRAE